MKVVNKSGWLLFTFNVHIAYFHTLTHMQTYVEPHAEAPACPSTHALYRHRHRDRDRQADRDDRSVSLTRLCCHQHISTIPLKTVPLFSLRQTAAEKHDT